MYINVWTCMFVRVHVDVCVYVGTVYMCMYVCMYVCYVYVNVVRVYVWTYICIMICKSDHVYIYV